MFRRLRALVAGTLRGLEAALLFIGTWVLRPLAVVIPTAVLFAYCGDTHANMFLADFAFAYGRAAWQVVTAPFALLALAAAPLWAALAVAYVVAATAWRLARLAAWACWCVARIPWRLLRFTSFLFGLFLFRGGALALAWLLAGALAGAAAYLQAALAVVALALTAPLPLWRRLDRLGDELAPLAEALGRRAGASVGRLCAALAAAWAPTGEALGARLEPAARALRAVARAHGRFARRRARGRAAVAAAVAAVSAAAGKAGDRVALAVSALVAALVAALAVPAWASWRLVRTALGTGLPSPLSGLWAPWQRPLDAPTLGLFERHLPDLGGDGLSPRVRAALLALAGAGLLGARAPSPLATPPGGGRPPLSPLEALDPLFASWSGRGHPPALPRLPGLREAADRVLAGAVDALDKRGRPEATCPPPTPTLQEATAERDRARLCLAWRVVLAAAIPLGLLLGPYLGFSSGPERPALALCMAGALAGPALVALAGLAHLAGDPWGWYHTHLLRRPDTPEGVGATVGDALWVLAALWVPAAAGLVGLWGRPGGALAAALAAALWASVTCLLALGDREALVRLWTHLARVMVFAAATASLAGPAPSLLWTGLGGAPVVAWALVALALAPWRAYHMAWPGRSPSLRQ
jgi:hypothetical protein